MFPAARQVDFKKGQVILEACDAVIQEARYEVQGNCTKCGVCLPNHLNAHWDSTRKIIVMNGPLHLLYRLANKEENVMIGERIHKRKNERQHTGYLKALASPKPKVKYKGILKAKPTKRATETHYE